MTNFKEGDRITTNPEWNEYHRNDTWWNEWRNKVMTVKRMIMNDNVIEVHENTLWWDIEWMLKVEDDFIEENEFLI